MGYFLRAKLIFADKLEKRIPGIHLKVYNIHTEPCEFVSSGNDCHGDPVRC
jgi:hypothetical protein